MRIEARNGGWWSIFRFCVDPCVNDAFQTYTKKENPGQKQLDLLGFRRSIVDTYYRCYRKEPKEPCFQVQERKPNILMKLGLTNWVIGLVKQNNDDVLNVEKQRYIFVKNPMLLYTQNVLRDSINSDRFTEWLAKKILLLGTGLCNPFTDILTIFYMLLIKKFLIKRKTFLKFLNSTFAHPPVSPFHQIYANLAR